MPSKQKLQNQNNLSASLCFMTCDISKIAVCLQDDVMAILYQLWYSIAMTYYDEIYEFAVDNHYLISTFDAKKLGIPGIELAKLAHRGKLENLARGLYRLTRYVPDGNDAYAVAVARAGKGAYLYGESVIAMLGLAPTNPEQIWVATPKRVRLKNAPAGLRLILAQPDDKLTIYDGIASQRAADAIFSCKDKMMPERLLQAARSGHEQGYITAKEYRHLQKDGVV